MRAKSPSFVTAFTSWWSRRTLAQRFATITAILIAGGAILQGVVMISVASSVVGSFERERVQQRLDKAANQLTLRVSEFSKIPQILAGTPPIRGIVALSRGRLPQPGESLAVWRWRLGVIFRSIILANPDLTQARFIGVADSGREVVRVKRIGNTIQIAEEDDLQRKGNRIYFREASKLKAGEIYLSRIEALVENGKVIRPFETTIRAATPVLSETGTLFGIIVANANAAYWLQELSELTELAGQSGSLLVADRKGDYVYRSDNGPLFGSFDGSPNRFQQRWPALSAILRPGSPSMIGRHEGDQFLAAHRVHYDPSKPNEYLVLATKADATAVFGDTWRFTLIGALVALLMAATGVVAAYFVSRPLKDMMAAAKKIAAGKLDVGERARSGHGADIGELGEALHIMKEAVESRDASLRKNEAYLKAIVDNTIDGLITIDRNAIIQRYNEGCKQIFGYSAAEVIGQNVNILMPVPIAQEHDGYLDRYARTGENRFIGVRREAQGRHKDGHTIDIEIAIAEISVGGEVFFSGIVRDITERKKIDRLKSEFVSTVTHELRTPLTSIMGSLGLLRSGALGKISGEAGRMVTLAYDNGNRLTALINDILDIDQLDSGELELRMDSENLHRLVMQSAKRLSGYAASCQASIVIDEIPDDIIVVTDAVRFEQIMANLISNAAKYSPKNGTIIIGAKLLDGTVRVTVSDQGPGVPPAFRPQVFQRFAQADSSDKRERGGTGLGLNITKGLVERMGGRIGFETEVGIGTTFYVELPAQRLQPTGSAPTAPVTAGADDTRRIA